MFLYGGFSYPDWGFSVLFPQLWGKCQGKTRKDGARTALYHISLYLCCSDVIICVVWLLFVLFYIVFLCKSLLPPGDNPIAVNKYILYHIPYRSETFHIRNSNNWNMPISRNLNSYKLNVEEFELQYLDFYVPSFIPSVTRTQGRKYKQLQCKFKKSLKYWNLKNLEKSFRKRQWTCRKTKSLWLPVSPDFKTYLCLVVK
jgi:hypothetical protein